jgi:hypothetical protein
VFAATLLVQLPLTLYRLVVALNDPDNSFSANQMIGDSIPAGLIPPLVGVVILVYDRRRIRREERQAGNLCLICGYDLRATPQRCPECGAVPDWPE